MKITSPAFEHDATIPDAHGAEGGNASPPLEISGVPDGTVTLALICEDPDVPRERRPSGMFDHWLVWNMPPDTTRLEEGGAPPGIEGRHGFGDFGYFGPRPPAGQEHGYHFHLFALDTELDGDPEQDKQQLYAAMQGHVLAHAVHSGRFAS